MKKDAKTLKKVAQQCSKFDAGEYQGSTATNSTGSSKNSGNVSCRKCTHYDPDKVCSLDLYQEIVQNQSL